MAKAVCEVEAEDHWSRVTGNKVRLLDLCEFIVDCEHKTAPTQADGYPSIRTPNIGRGRFILDGVNRVSEETYRAWTKRATPQQGDLIMAREAPVGNVALVPAGLNPCLGQRTLLIRPVQEKVDAAYLTYLLISPQIQSLIHARTNGATVAHLNMKDVRELNLPRLPPLGEQRRIAGILSAYDDLIENCERRIRVLDEMARALYREWFVLFRYPGHEKTPLVDSPLGQIPKGWDVKRLSELIEAHIGGGWGKESPDKDHTQPAWVIRGTDIPAARLGGVAGVPYRYHSSSNIRSRTLQPLDIVFEVSGGSKGQPVGRTLLMSAGILDALPGPCICASFCKKVRPRAELFSPHALYLSFLEAYDSGEISTYQVQSTGISNFKWSEYIGSVSRAVPPAEIQARFDAVVGAWFDEVTNLGQRVANLRKTRDLLLPRLLSGQLAVEDAA
jgi:type I restriction enzyme S subunit